LTEIIFAKPVHHYDSYRDFWRLVELSNFPVIRVDEIDLTKDYIVITSPMNGDYKEYITGDWEHWEKTGEVIGGEIIRQKHSGLPRLAHLVVWNLERPAGSGSVGGYAKDSFKWFYSRIADEIWVSDPGLADETMLRYVTLGSDYGLGEIGNDKQYDFTHMSVAIPRRVHIYKDFNNGQIGPNCWPPERNEVLKKSRFALNVHQDNHPFCEPLRIALFAAYGLPIVSETLAGNNIYGGDIYQLPYHGLVDGLKSVLKDDYTKWQEMGLRLREKLCEDYQFGKMVRKAISESAGIGWR
jgi:hypothetical protein